MDVDVVFVKLKSSDGKIFNFTESEASCSNALKSMLDSTKQYRNNNPASGANGHSVHLQSIDSKVLSNIQQWCKMHSYNQSTVSNNINSDNYDAGTGTRLPEDEEVEHGSQRRLRPRELSMDMKFLASFSEVDLLKLMNAANFLDVRGLYDACCKFMATRWEGMKVEDIRKAYNIRNDLTREEELQIIQENKKIGFNEPLNDV